jgi:phosphodiesterase/alkaline phosphatase D-like protein
MIPEKRTSNFLSGTACLLMGINFSKELLTRTLLWFLLLVNFLVPINVVFMQTANAALSAPTISSITGQNGYVEVAFTGIAGATNYDYSTDGGITWSSRTPAATWSPLSIYGLTNGVSYSIKIRARDASGPGTASLVSTATPTSRSQILNSQGFLQGKYVEIGVRANGAFGSGTAVPTGFHGNTGTCLGFRVDRQKNGWGATQGSSAPFVNIDDGDYFCPGTQYEGWALKVNTNSTTFNNHSGTGITGAISNIVSNSTEQKVDWTASSSSNGILVKQTAVVPNDGQSLHIDITLTNTTGSSIPNIYYLRGYDPDNATGSLNGLSSVPYSINTVMVRGGVGVSAEVKATFASGAQVLLRSTDSRARAATNNSGDCCTPSTAEPITVWNASSPFAQAVGVPTSSADQQVALALKVDSLASGSSTTFRVSYVLTAEDANSPSVATEVASNVDTTTSATLNGTINPNGATTSVEFEYGTDPSLASNVTSVSAGSLSGSSSSPASVSISNLSRGTTYYFRAKGTNSVGSSYGSILSFTPIGPPQALVSAASSIGETSSVLNGSVNSQGGQTSEIFFLWSTSAVFASDTHTVLTNPSSISGNTNTSIAANLSGLVAGTTYYYKIKVTNQAGTTYSDSVSFTTTPAPSAITDTATSVTATGATLNGRVNARGVSTTQIYFSYSTIADLSSGVTTVNTSPSQATGLTEISVSASLSGLTTGTTYYVRLTAVNPNGTNSGEIRSFTPSTAPVVTTETATVSGTTATLLGTINPRGAATTSVVFVYSTNSLLASDTATATISPGTLSGATDQSVSKSISGLTPLTTYYYRAVATNVNGSTSGSILSFTTPFADVVSPSETLTATSSSYSKIESILITITFSESITGLTATDVTLGGTSASAYGKGTPQTINAFTYTILLSPSSASPGTLTVSVPAGGVVDYSGNSNLISNTLSLIIKNVQATFTLSVPNGDYLTLLRATSSGGSGGGAVNYSASAGSATGCSVINSDSVTSTSAGTCVVVGTKAGDADYAPISDTKTVTFAKISQQALQIGQYTAFVGISTYPLNVYGGSGTGTVTRSLVNSGTAECTISSGMFLTAAKVGSCDVQATKPGDVNYLDQISSATIYWIQWSDAYATRVPSTPTEIVLNHQTQIIKYSYETLTATSFADSSGNAITSASVGQVIRLIGTGFVSTDDQTTINLANGEMVEFANLTFNTTDPMANYIQFTIPSGVTTDVVGVSSRKGTIYTTAQLTITP